MLKQAFAIALSLAVALAAGCAEFTQPSKEEMGTAIKADLAKQSGRAVKDVDLIREGDHALSGFATLEDGAKVNVSVTVDRDKYMWTYPAGIGDAANGAAQNQTDNQIRELLADDSKTYTIEGLYVGEPGSTIIHRVLPGADVKKVSGETKGGWGDLTYKGKTMAFYYEDGVLDKKAPSVIISAHGPGEDGE